MVCALLVFGAPCQLRLLAGQEHGRTIPLTDNRTTPGQSSKRKRLLDARRHRGLVRRSTDCPARSRDKTARKPLSSLLCISFGTKASLPRDVIAAFCSGEHERGTSGGDPGR